MISLHRYSKSNCVLQVLPYVDSILTTLCRHAGDTVMSMNAKCTKVKCRSGAWKLILICFEGSSRSLHKEYYRGWLYKPMLVRLFNILPKKKGLKQDCSTVLSVRLCWLHSFVMEPHSLKIRLILLSLDVSVFFFTFHFFCIDHTICYPNQRARCASSFSLHLAYIATYCNGVWRAGSNLH